jgi:hypothetical protein
MENVQMIITDDFVYIHLPKTGGTFVTTIIKEIYRFKKNYRYIFGFLPEKIQTKLINNQRIRGRIQGFLDINKHGTCREIPLFHRNKPILACIRNPLDRYVSLYEFGWWKKFPRQVFHPIELEEIYKMYPNFPNLSFEEFYYLYNSILLPYLVEDKNFIIEGFGFQTFQFINFFFKNPGKILSLIDDDYLVNQRFREDIFNVHFMRTEQLNRDLYSFLLRIGWNQKDVEHILNQEKIFPPRGGRSEDKVWEDYYSAELKTIAMKGERLIFSIFPEFGS